MTPAVQMDVVITLSTVAGAFVGAAFGAVVASVRHRRRPTPPVAPVTAVLPRVTDTTVQFRPVRDVHLITTQPERQQPHVWHYGGKSHATHNGGTR